MNDLYARQLFDSMALAYVAAVLRKPNADKQDFNELAGKAYQFASSMWAAGNLAAKTLGMQGGGSA